MNFELYLRLHGFLLKSRGIPSFGYSIVDLEILIYLFVFLTFYIKSRGILLSRGILKSGYGMFTRRAKTGGGVSIVVIYY